MKLYEYMVVYSGENITGRICITRTELIKSYSDVEEIDKIIENHNGFKNVFVTDFKLLRKYKKTEDKNESKNN